MSFASAWLREKALFPPFIAEHPQKDTGIIIVVPAYNETGVPALLESLSECSPPGCHVEVILVVNAPPDAPAEHLTVNKHTVEAVSGFISPGGFLSIRCIEPPPLPGWGVGMARKTGMDEALRRFDVLGRPEGVILSLDADCFVNKNYLEAVYSELAIRKERSACSIYFEHPIAGNEYEESSYASIALYELHLRYYYQALKQTGFPYVFHTVGSAMAVKALPYMKSGGMNRKQAGEDFYFIQKLAQAGGYFNINSTAVYPSPRTSFRVPFGTGATMGRLAKEKNNVLLSYDLRAFKDLNETFAAVPEFYGCDESRIGGLFDRLPESIRLFSDKNEWTEKTMEIRKNTSSPASFRKRFFAWFNMFKIVKYLNHVHQDLLKKQPVEKPSSELLKILGMLPGNNVRELLENYRSLERDQ